MNDLIKSISNNYQSSNSPSEQSIKLLSKICKNKCKPVIVYIPYSSFWLPLPEEKGKIYKKHLRNMAIKSGIQFIDGGKVIDSNNLHDYMPKGGHLSDFGNKKIGDLISEEIAN